MTDGRLSTLDATDRPRAGDRHGHERGRPQHRRRRPRGPRLVRRRQPAARPAPARWSSSVRRTRGEVPRIAAVVDVRGRSFFADLRGRDGRPRAASDVPPRLVFLEASDEVLVRRFEAVPPQAPAAGRRAAHRRHRRRARAALRPPRRRRPRHRHLRAQRPPAAREGRGRVRRRRTTGPAATVVSFGYKYGLPVDADLVLDCRFLPNPHWVPELRPQTGLDPDVSRLRARTARRHRAPRQLPHVLDILGAGLPARGQALRHRRRRLHRRQAPQRRDGRGARPAASRGRASRPASSTATWAASERPSA